MNKIYTLMNKSNVDWKSDVLYPISLFSVACLILLLSSFSTKASYETANINLTTSETSSYEATELATISMGNYSQINTSESMADLNLHSSRLPKTKINKSLESFTSDLFLMIRSPRQSKQKTLDNYISIYTDITANDDTVLADQLN